MPPLPPKQNKMRKTLFIIFIVLSISGFSLYDFVDRGQVFFSIVPVFQSMGRLIYLIGRLIYETIPIGILVPMVLLILFLLMSFLVKRIKRFRKKKYILRDTSNQNK